jgi:branched-chain amino acid transport system permease protein
MAEILTNLIVALSQGCIYGLVGFSLMAIYHCVNMVNFAQGDLVMLGGFLGYLTITSLQQPVWVSCIAILIVMPFVGVIFWLLVKRLIRLNAKPVALMLVTMGGGMILVSFIGIPTSWDWLPVLPFVRGVWNIWGIVIPPQYMIIIITTGIFMIAFWFFITKTHYGWAFRAVIIDKQVATLAGIRISYMTAIAFSMASFAGGMGGLLIAPTITPSADMGMPYMIKGFIAAMVGGIDNSYGPLLGGIFLGVIEIIIVGYTAPFYGELATFCMLLGFLLFWPHGILGGRSGVRISRYG